ncbi:relaxin receptor 2 isoform X3 [Zophobas morio]|uniref:relaxin receptor 2 isoform X3 n=1 Tax=Zophobas morio TaxID=2755281 RepID=UPI0030837A3E
MAELYFIISVFLVNAPQRFVTGEVSNDSEVCGNGKFLCENSTECLLINKYCDGNRDCPDGSDEDEVKCRDKEDDKFWDHMFQKRPWAENDHHPKICNFSYNGSCMCRKRDLFCGQQGLKIIPEDLPDEDIDLLDLEVNEFGYLSRDLLKPVPPNVAKINFAHCQISQLEPHTFFDVSRIQKIHLDNNDLRTLPSELFPQHNDLKTLSVRHNRISGIHPDAFRELVKLEELDLRGNRLAEIRREVFAPLKSLQFLHLQNNGIRYVTVNTFPPLPLESLSLTNNKIDSLERGTFSMMPSLKHLYLSSNKLVHLKDGIFLNLTLLRILYFDRFELCINALHVKDCYPKGDGISSQEHLLDNPVLRASVWIMAAIGCTGNMIVLLGRLLAPNNNVVHSLYLRNLAMSDLLMGVYLFAIAVADQHYRGVYLLYDGAWRKSFMCNLCGFLCTLSCESSVLILTLVTWDRFVSVTQPLARKQPSPRTAALTLVVLWTLAVAVALAPFSKGYFGNQFYGSNGVCLPLHIHHPYDKGWQYSAVMFMVVNALALIFICYAYLRMIHEIRASGVACRSTRQSQERDKVAQRFGIIVLTDCMCWVPIIVVKLVALAGCSVPKDLYAWLAIFILPINSALNPVLYTLTTTVFKKQVRKIINSCIHKNRRPDPQHSASDSGFSLSFGVFPKGGSTRRILTYRVGLRKSGNEDRKSDILLQGTQSSLTTSKNSWKRPPTAV